MSAPAHAPAIAFLRRASLIAAVLALMTGIFGMHVMTASHTMHSPAAAAGAAGAHHDASRAGHAGEHASEPSSASYTPGAPEETGTRAGQCTAPDNCACMSAMAAGCTPSAKTGSLAAPLPGTGFIARTITTGPAGTISSRWSYLPGSPSPGRLSISRT